MTFGIRLLDREGVAALLGDISRIENESFSTPWSADSFLTLPSEVLFAGAFDGDGKLIGYGCLIALGEESELLNLAVTGSQRRRGAGGGLLDFLIEEVGRSGARRCYLEVRASNEAARSLYVSRGFYRLGLRRDYYRKPKEDAVIMALDVPHFDIGD